MRLRTLKELSIIMLASSALVGCGGKSNLTANMQAIKNNYTNIILRDNSTKDYEGKSIDEIMKNILSKKISGRDTYYFSDIDYDSCEERASFPAAGHLSRAKQITLLAKKTNNNKLYDIAIKLVRHWVLSNYRSINWWNNEIGCNNNLTDIGIILFDKLDRFTQDAFRGKVRESSLYYRPQLRTHEGSNLINYINMSLKNSVFDNNEEEFKVVQDTTNGILKYASRAQEGFMKDGTFHQHGTEMQTGAYGLEAVGNIGKIVEATEGTNFSISDEGLGIISNFVLNGINGIVHKGKFNYMGLNRAYTRPNAGIAKNGTGYKQLRYFEKFNLPDKENYQNLLTKIDNNETNLEENTIHIYPDSNFIAANVGGIYMSFMSANSNGRVTESTNGENQLGYNFAWGNNTCVMDTGDEYYNISPVWDYSRLPGCTSVDFKATSTTTQSEADNNLMNYTKDIGNAQYSNKLPVKSPDSTTDCVYNFSEKLSDNGVAYSMCQSFKDVMSDSSGSAVANSGNSFTISCFVTTDGMVLVGSGFGIGEANKEYFDKYSDSTLHTTVEQCIVDGKSPEVKTEEKTIKNDNVIYSALGSDDSLTSIKQTQTGTYQRNNPNGASSVTEIQSHDVLTITYNSSDASTKSYAYSIQPTSKSESKFTLLANNDNVHAIKLPDGKAIGCFYKDIDSFKGIDGITYKRDTTKYPYVAAKGVYVDELSVG